jgi:predicted ArsR family transcriptional regulator
MSNAISTTGTGVNLDLMPDRWTPVVALADASRRALYEYVRRQGRPVSREEAGDAARMSRGLAAFHLEKLVDAGLLRAGVRAAGGRRGRGRAPKVYEVAGDGLAITIPQRRYELIAEILADAVADDPANAGEAAHRRAAERGRELGTRLRATGAGPVHLADALADVGFEPEAADGGGTALRNCPFHALAERQTALVCGLNQAFVAGLLEGLAVSGVRAELAPRPGYCCVALSA